MKTSKVVKPKTPLKQKPSKPKTVKVLAPSGFPKELMVEIFMNLPPKEAIHKCAHTKACDNTFWNKKLNKDYGHIVGVRTKREDPKRRYCDITSLINKFEKLIGTKGIIMSIDYMILANLWKLEKWVQGPDDLGVYDLYIQTNFERPGGKIKSVLYSGRGSKLAIIENDIPKEEAIKRYVLFELTKNKNKSS